MHLKEQEEVVRQTTWVAILQKTFNQKTNVIISQRYHVDHGKRIANEHILIKYKRFCANFYSFTIIFIIVLATQIIKEFDKTFLYHTYPY